MTTGRQEAPTCHMAMLPLRRVLVTAVLWSCPARCLTTTTSSRTSVWVCLPQRCHGSQEVHSRRHRGRKGGTGFGTRQSSEEEERGTRQGASLCNFGSQSWPYNLDSTASGDPGVDGISFTVHPWVVVPPDTVVSPPFSAGSAHLPRTELAPRRPSPAAVHLLETCAERRCKLRPAQGPNRRRRLCLDARPLDRVPG